MPPTAASAPIEAWRTRALAEVWRFGRTDLTGHAMKLTVRLYPGAPGTPLIALANVTAAGAQGLRLRGVENEGWSETSVVEVVIGKTAMNALPSAAEPGKPIELAYDLTFTPPGGVEQVVAFGPFIVHPGVTA